MDTKDRVYREHRRLNFVPSVLHFLICTAIDFEVVDEKAEGSALPRESISDWRRTLRILPPRVLNELLDLGDFLRLSQSI